jgi:hypothetical protein
MTSLGCLNNPDDGPTDGKNSGCYGTNFHGAAVFQSRHTAHGARTIHCLSGGKICLRGRMLGREGYTRRSTVSGIKQVSTTSPKSAKTSAGKGVATKRPVKGAGVAVTAKRASKGTDVVAATRFAGKAAGGAVAANHANKTAKGATLAAQRATKVMMPVMKVTFGHVSVSVQQPTAANVKRAVTASKKVAKGLGERLVKPGVALRHPPGVPVFTADPLDPLRVVRRLHGKVERGHFVKGQFKPEKSPA